MKEIPLITNAELEVMKVIWNKAPIKSADIVKTLENMKDWKPKTIKTLIRRLSDKGAISYTTEGNAYIYNANINKKDYVDKETDSFLDKLYSGSLNHLMLNFVKEKKLSSEQISELIKILQNSES